MVSCPRCNTEMIANVYTDLHDDTGVYRFTAWRCLMCGAVTDPVIAANRARPPVPAHSRARHLLAS